MVFEIFCVSLSYFLLTLQSPNFMVYQKSTSWMPQLDRWLLLQLPLLSPCRMAEWFHFIYYKFQKSIKNSTELCTQLKDITIFSSGLFWGIQLVPQYTLHNVLSQSGKLTSTCISDIVALVSFVIDQNFFQFKDTFYHSKRWLSHGLCPLLAEICMSNIEVLLNQSALLSTILFYRRYVDDIICIFNGTLNQLQHFTWFY